ncbi:MAG: tyrosine-type recombinase/integrase [Syntrophobacter sp.]
MADSNRQKMDKFTGVYYREHPTRKHNGKPDRCFDISYKTLSGKKQWETVGWRHDGYTAEMAAQVRGERIRALRHGEELPNKKIDALTFSELWKEYAKWAEVNRKSFKAETSRYNQHIKPVLGKTPVTEINPFQLEKLKSDLHKKELSPQTIKHVLVLIRQALNQGVSLGLWKGENPVKQVKIPRPNNKRERFLTSEEAVKLLNELGKISPQLRGMALLSLNTGLRAGEIFGLRWNHINLEDGIITLVDPKSGQAQKAFMNQTAKAMLSGRAEGKTPEEFVFKDRFGDQIREVSDTFERTVEALNLNAGIDKKDRTHRVTFHTLRHTFASWLALEGTPILTIKELLRHSSLTMTERYAHLIPDVKKQAVTVIDARLNQQFEPCESESTSEGHQAHTG